MMLRWRSRFGRMPAAFWVISVAIGGMICTESPGMLGQEPGSESAEPGPGAPPIREGATPGEEGWRVPSVGDHVMAEPPFAEPEVPEPSLAPPLSFLEPPPLDTTFPSLTQDPAFWAAFRRRCSGSCVEDFLEEMMSVPDAILSCAMGSAHET